MNDVKKINYHDGFTGHDPYEHMWFVKMINAGLTVEEANILARIKTNMDKEKYIM